MPKEHPKRRYNWKARQRGGGSGRSSEKGESGRRNQPEPQNGDPEHCGDTNALVLPSRPKRGRKEDAEEGGSRQQKRRKLGPKQKKRLKKVLETKERKARVRRLLFQLVRSHVVTMSHRGGEPERVQFLHGA